jgi:hypothetical protein
VSDRVEVDAVLVRLGVDDHIVRRCPGANDRLDLGMDFGQGCVGDPFGVPVPGPGAGEVVVRGRAAGRADGLRFRGIDEDPDFPVLIQDDRLIGAGQVLPDGGGRPGLLGPGLDPGVRPAFSWMDSR